MKTIQFSTREQAIKYLRSQEFEFMGAPNRWRKFEDERVVYAKVQIDQHGVTVIMADSKRPLT
jgi:hypothetical protein